jgi:hypothetical protein
MARGSGYDGVVDAISHQLASGIDAQMQRFPFLCNELSSSIPKKDEGVKHHFISKYSSAAEKIFKRTS